MRIGILVALVLAGVPLAGCAKGAATTDATLLGNDDAPEVVSDAECGLASCDGVYVATTGNDNAGGTQAAPLKTITAAITKAGFSSPAKPVFVQVGVYLETIAMKSGITIYGGFDTTWKRDSAMATEIDGMSPAITFDAITAPTALDKITVKSADATAPGASSVGIAITGSVLVELDDVRVLPGVGAPGISGNNGSTGGSGSPGTSGGPGVEHSSGFLCDSHTVPVGGPGGGSACGRNGGDGGNPGVGGNGGANGGAGSGGTQFGFGAPGSTQNASAGADGGNGSSGTGGPAGTAAGTFTGLVYIPSNGGDGTSGGDANGGGGGGGGGGGTSNCVSSGSSGGGGGGGGCAGTTGIGGSGGGGSFGVVAVDSQVIVKASMVLANHGGAGGHGGDGGPGGPGAIGGVGGPYGGSGEQDDGGLGAAGGRGGNGGSGGSGGGGGGGPSAATVCVGSASMSIPQTTLSGGVGGAGGSSTGNPGATGTSTRAIGCSFF